MLYQLIFTAFPLKGSLAEIYSYTENVRFEYLVVYPKLEDYSNTLVTQFYNVA